MTQPPIWLLIDGTHHVYRDFYAAGDRDASLLRARIPLLFDHFKPARIVAAFDCGPSFRSRLFPAYKGERSKPEEIDAAIDAAKAAYIDEEIDLIEAPDFEADDILATLSRLGRSLGNRIVIASADKDLHQLILEGEVLQAVRLLRDRDQLSPGYVNANDLQVQYFVTPEQWVDYRCLIGDKSDNIDGVRGIGKETAGRILSQIGSLDAFYANPFKVAGIKPGIHAKLINAKPRIPLLRQLLTLRDDVPLPEGWSDVAT